MDALGIFEYFNDADAVIFLQRCIGWERIFPRTLQQLQDIHIAAGVPVENVTVVVPRDGVYAVMEVRV